MTRKVNFGAVKQRIAVLIIAVAVLIYAVYHVTSLFGEDISTIATGISTQRTVLDGKGYVFRDERVLYSEYSGVAEYLKGDGEKVSVGDELAVVSEEGTLAGKNLVRFLDQKIDILEQSASAGYTLADLPQINDDISDCYYELAKMLAVGDTGGISEQSDKLLYSMNCHSMLTDEQSPVVNTLEKMKTQREGIFSGGGDSVVEYADDSGYFYSYVDGYEELFTVDAANSMTADNYYALSNGKVSSDRNAVETAYGKMADSSEWRFVVRMPAVTADYFKLRQTYNMQFIENGNITIPMELVSAVDDTLAGGKILVFFSNRAPENFVFDRCQSISVEVYSASGIYVPRGAVHRMGGEYCVYVLKGSVVTMRRIDVIYETKDYFLCATDVESDGSIEYLDTNELLIVGGSNLFDGRILD